MHRGEDLPTLRTQLELHEGRLLLHMPLSTIRIYRHRDSAAVQLKAASQATEYRCFRIGRKVL